MRPNTRVAAVVRRIAVDVYQLARRRLARRDDPAVRPERSQPRRPGAGQLSARTHRDSHVVLAAGHRITKRQAVGEARRGDGDLGDRRAFRAHRAHAIREIGGHAIEVVMRQDQTRAVIRRQSAAIGSPFDVDVLRAELDRPREYIEPRGFVSVPAAPFPRRPARHDDWMPAAGERARDVDARHAVEPQFDEVRVLYGVPRRAEPGHRVGRHRFTDERAHLKRRLPAPENAKRASPAFAEEALNPCATTSLTRAALLS